MSIIVILEVRFMIDICIITGICTNYIIIIPTIWTQLLKRTNIKIMLFPWSHHNKNYWVSLSSSPIHTYTCAGTVNKAGDTPLSLAYKSRYLALETIKYLTQEHQCDPNCVCSKLLLSSVHNYACIHSCSEWGWRYSSLPRVFPWWPEDGQGSH